MGDMEMEKITKIWRKIGDNRYLIITNTPGNK